MDTYKLSVRLPIDLAAALKRLSEDDGRTLQTLAERAIRNYLVARGAEVAE